MVWRLFQFTLAIAIGLLLFGIYTLYSSQSVLTKVPAEYTFGPETADLKVVAFLDYSCTHCRESYAPMMEAIEKDGNVQFAPLLVTTPNSTDEYAMRLTYAAALVGKYKEFFQDIMGNYRTIDERGVTDLALKYGMDPEKLIQTLDNKLVDQLAAKSMVVFKKLNGQYTPTFFVGPHIKYVPTETPTTEDFLRVFQEARGEKASEPVTTEEKK